MGNKKYQDVPEHTGAIPAESILLLKLPDVAALRRVTIENFLANLPSEIVATASSGATDAPQFDVTSLELDLDTVSGTGILFPDRSLVEYVWIEVIDEIEGPTEFTANFVGLDPMVLFGTDVTAASGVSSGSTAQFVPATPAAAQMLSATGLVLTFDAPVESGSVRITTRYRAFGPPSA